MRALRLWKSSLRRQDCSDEIGGELARNQRSADRTLRDPCRTVSSPLTAYLRTQNFTNPERGFIQPRSGTENQETSSG
jgi:hypothetical protein